MENLKQLTNQELLDLYGKITDFINFLETEKETIEKSGDENG